MQLPVPAASEAITHTVGGGMRARVAHALPGRVRLAHPLWRQPALAQAVAYTLRTLPGVVEADVNPLTGRALVRTRPEVGPDELARTATELTRNLWPSHRGVARSAPRGALRGVGTGGGGDRAAFLPAGDRRTARLLLLTVGMLAYAGIRTVAAGRGRLALDPRVAVLSWAVSILQNHKLVRLAAQCVPGVAFFTGDATLSAAATLAHAARQSTAGLAVQTVSQQARWMSGRAASARGLERHEAVPWGKTVETYGRRSTLVGLGAAAASWYLGSGIWGATAALLATNPRPVRLTAHRVHARWVQGTLRRGWLPGGPQVAEHLADVDGFVLQWDGLATTGRDEVVEVVTFAGASEAAVLRIAAAAARGAAQAAQGGGGWTPADVAAIDAACRVQGIARPVAEQVESFATGTSLRLQGEPYLTGEESFVRVRRVRTRHARPSAWRLREMGCRVIYVSGRQSLLGLIGIGPRVRPEVERLVETLRALDVEPLAAITRRHDLRPVPAFRETLVLHDAGAQARLRRLVAGRRILAVGAGDLLAFVRAVLAGAPGSVMARVDGAGPPEASRPAGPQDDLVGAAPALPYLAWVVVAARVGREVLHQAVAASAAAGVGASALAAAGRLVPGQTARFNQWLSLAAAVNEARVGAVLDRYPAPPPGLPGPGEPPGPGGPAWGGGAGNEGGRDDGGGPGDGGGPPYGGGAGDGDGLAAPVWLSTATHDGLSAREARARLARFGPNMLDVARPLSPWQLIRRYATEPLTLTLLGAAALAAAGRAWVDAVAVLVVVGGNAALGALIEHRTEQVLRHIQELAAPMARVVRDGREQLVAASSLVPGDIVLLGTGDRVPADGRLVEGYWMEVNEAPLTGESAPVPKEPMAQGGATPDLPVTPATVDSQVWMGTTVVRGRGRTVVMATGKQTQVATILRDALAPPVEATPLQRRLAQAAHTTGLYSMGIGTLVGLTGLARGYPVPAMANVALSMAVAAVPEGLPLLSTVALARAAARLSPRRVLVRRLAALETLGRVSVVCMDKTGTLTYNRLEVVQFVDARHLLLGARASDGDLETASAGASGTVNGCGPDAGGPDASGPARVAYAAALAGEGEDAIERGLAEGARSWGIEPERLWTRFPRLDEQPFDAELGFSAALRRLDGRPVWFVKGSVERIADRCASLSGDAPARRLLDATVQELASRQLRVIGLAVVEGPQPPGQRLDLQLVGLAAMADPVRPEASSFVEACAAAGIRVLMLTGDHEATARRVAEAVGIPATVGLTGDQIERITDDELAVVTRAASVYARVRPHHKARLVRALQAQGHVVAMAGDGVNDAPALRVADVGMVIGGGASLAEDAAQLVLLDGDLSSVASALREGTLLRQRIRRALRFLLSGNWGEIVVVGGSLAVQGEAAMAPSQLLLLNVLTDVLPAMALVVDDPQTAPSEVILARRETDGALLAPEQVRHSLVAGTWAGMTAWSAWSLARAGVLAPPSARQSVAMGAIVAAQLAQLDRWMPGAYRGRWTGLATLSTAGTLVAAMLVPPLSRLFQLPWPGAGAWALVGAAGLGARLLATLGKEEAPA